MSYCRSSCDDWLSNVYVIGTVSDGFSIMVTSNTIADPDAYREKLPALLPEPEADDGDDVWERYDARDELVLALYRQAPKVDLDHPMAGKSIGADDRAACIEVLEGLRRDGLHVPQHALDRLREEQAAGEVPA